MKIQVLKILKHVEMYVNHFCSRVLNDRTETAIIYDKSTGIEILDPYDSNF